MKRNQSKDTPAFESGPRPSSSHSPHSRNLWLGLPRSNSPGLSNFPMPAPPLSPSQSGCGQTKTCLFQAHYQTPEMLACWHMWSEKRRWATWQTPRSDATSDTKESCTVPGGTARPGRCVERTEQAPFFSSRF
ncbi:hypothetical protein Q5P01_000337 [Channa striata]|uniref:Uncharacterized protein n=1 Tax=Channa striata TaxID=64152 RepID=A0AA88LLX0_CHASR|nr:hypothetical protein Q5P01_000337 [Channa striata]